MSRQHRIPAAAMLATALLLGAPGCAHRREAYYPPALKVPGRPVSRGIPTPRPKTAKAKPTPPATRVDLGARTDDGPRDEPTASSSPTSASSAARRRFPNLGRPGYTGRIAARAQILRSPNDDPEPTI
jgi:hypothetical protein